MRIAIAIVLLLLAGLVRADEAAWEHLQKGGYVVIMRHALTDPPRGEDPPGFTYDDCATQRNLSPRGIAEAKALGAAFSRRGAAIGEVFSSRYCRCQDTARLAFGNYEVWDVLNGYRGPQPWWEAFDFERLLEIRKRLSDPVGGPGNRIIVTHNTHIKALTDLWVDPGEMLVVRPLGRMFFTVVGRLRVEDY